jgi:hypothetical protein
MLRACVRTVSMPIESWWARWIALTTSRASVSFDRQAVAPNDSIWLHSAAVGRLASTTILVSG